MIDDGGESARDGYLLTGPCISVLGPKELRSLADALEREGKTLSSILQWNEWPDARPPEVPHDVIWLAEVESTPEGPGHWLWGLRYDGTWEEV